MNKPILLIYLENNFFKAFILLILWSSAVFWLFQQYHITLVILGLLWIGLKHIHNWLTHLIAALIPISLMWILYHTVTQAWWLADDPTFLQSIIEHGIFSHFYQSEMWRSLIFGTNLMPWITLSFGIDWHLFGLEPLGFYWHHLLSFSIVLLIAYIVLNLFFSPLVCSLTLSLLVASIPSANIAQFLMLRHYLEGLGLSLLAIFAYVKAVQTQRHGWAYFGSLFYLLATTAKEIYVPLVVILPCLPVGLWAQRWKSLIPFVVVAGSYVLWRAYMLKPSHLLTGYGDAIPKLTWDGFLALPNSVVEILGWHHTWQLLIVLLAVLLYLGLIYRQNACILVWLAAILLPILPVLSLLNLRYLFLPYFVFCLAIAFSLQWLMNKQWHYVALGLGLSLFAVGIKSIESPTMLRQAERVKQSRIEGELILTGNNIKALLLHPSELFIYYQSLQWLRETFLKLPKGSRVCYDSCVCQPQATESLYQYRQGQFVSSQVSEHCGKEDADLTVSFYSASGALHWQLGPYQRGQYYIAPSERELVSGQFYLVPPQGSYPWALSKKSYFVFKYVSPEGWQTYSPTLMLEPAQKDAQGIARLTWKRH